MKKIVFKKTLLLILVGISTYSFCNSANNYRGSGMSAYDYNWYYGECAIEMIYKGFNKSNINKSMSCDAGDFSGPPFFVLIASAGFSSEAQTAARYFKKLGADVNASGVVSGHHYPNAFLAAALVGNINVPFCKSLGMDINSTMPDGNNAVLTVMKNANEEGSWSAKQWRLGHAYALLNGGVNPNATNKQGQSTLLKAVQYNFFSIVCYLISNGVNIEQYGPQALTAARGKKYTNIITLLNNCLSDGWQKKDSNGANPFLAAVKKNNTMVADAYLYRAQVKKALPGYINDADKLGNSPLYYALKNQNYSYAAKLMKLGASIYFVNKKGETALTVVMGNKNLDKTFLSQFLNAGLAINDGLLASARKGSPRTQSAKLQKQLAGVNTKLAVVLSDADSLAKNLKGQTKGSYMYTVLEAAVKKNEASRINLQKQQKQLEAQIAKQPITRFTLLKNYIAGVGPRLMQAVKSKNTKQAIMLIKQVGGISDSQLQGLFPQIEKQPLTYQVGGFTPLLLAAKTNLTSIFTALMGFITNKKEMMLASQGPGNYSEQNFSVLAWGIYNANATVVQTLIKAGIAPTQKDIMSAQIFEGSSSGAKKQAYGKVLTILEK